MWTSFNRLNRCKASRLFDYGFKNIVKRWERKNGDANMKILIIVTKIFFQYIQTDPPTKESLAQLIVQLLQYQETKLGKNIQDAMTTRLPVIEKI